MRTPRQYTTASIVTGFARFGVALDTIARALVVPTDQVEVIARRAKNRGEIEMLPPRNPTDTKSALQAEVVNLRAMLSDKQTLLDEIASKQDTDIDFIGAHTKLTRREAMLIAELAREARVVSKERIFFALYGNDVDEAPEPKIIDVFICKLRKKLPVDVTVDTVWGRGYEMTRKSCQNFRAWAGLPVVESPALCPSDLVAA